MTRNEVIREEFQIFNLSEKVQETKIIGMIISKGWKKIRKPLKTRIGPIFSKRKKSTGRPRKRWEP